MGMVSGEMKKFWRWTLVIVMQYHEQSQCHRMVHFKMVEVVNFMCILQFLKKDNQVPSPHHPTLPLSCTPEAHFSLLSHLCHLDDFKPFFCGFSP